MRYQTSIALDQVESNDSIGSATDTFNLIQPEPTGKALPTNTLREHSSALSDTTKSFNDDLSITKEDQTELEVRTLFYRAERITPYEARFLTYLFALLF